MNEWLVDCRQPVDVLAALMVWLESGLRSGVSIEFLVEFRTPGSFTLVFGPPKHTVLYFSHSGYKISKAFQEMPPESDLSSRQHLEMVARPSP